MVYGCEGFKSPLQNPINQKIIEQARLILTAAQAIMEQSDRCFARPSAAQAAQCAKTLPARLCGSGTGTGDLANIKIKSL
jgi:hypothetical protein